jgi:predicted ester cyclase
MHSTLEVGGPILSTREKIAARSESREQEERTMSRVFVPLDGSHDMATDITTKHMRELGLRLYREAFARGKLEVVDELVAADCIDMSPRLPEGVGRTGPGPLKEVVRMLHSAFPDLCVRVHELHIDGDTLISRITLEGMHEGKFLDMAPTGRWIAWDAIDIIRVRRGTIREHYGLWDEVGLVQQLHTSPIHERPEG